MPSAPTGFLFGFYFGDIIKVKITDVMEYDLIGEIFDEFSK